MTHNILTEACTDAARAHARDLEYELRAAWRAGYNYLHVYDAHQVGDDRFVIRSYCYPAYSEKPIRDDQALPDGAVYKYTYDLTSVPDHEVREVIRSNPIPLE